MIDKRPQAGGLRGRVLDWAWNHPHWKRRMREVWGIARETAGLACFSLGRSNHQSGRASAASRDGCSAQPRSRASAVHELARMVVPPRHRNGARPCRTPPGRCPDLRLLRGAAPDLRRDASERGAPDAVPLVPRVCLGCDQGSGLRERRPPRCPRRRRRGRDRAPPCRRVDHGARMRGVRGSGSGARRLVRISVAWFLPRGTLLDTPQTLKAYRSFLVSGMVVARGLRNIMSCTAPQRVFMLNGTFFAESIMIALCDQQGIPFGTYEKGFIHY